MRRYISFLLTGLVLGGIAGLAGGIFVYPYLGRHNTAVVESTPAVSEVPTGALVASGRFVQADPLDPIHRGKGGVKVYENLLRLESDFEVGPGPKYHVYLVPAADVTPNTAVEKTMFVDLGRLRAFKGSQDYPIPAGVDVKHYPFAVIWCEQFNALISPARLEFVK